MDSLTVTPVNENNKEPNPQQPKQGKGIFSHFTSLVRELLAVSFWAFVIIKLFVYDIDIYLLSKCLPKYVWLLNYKFFILIGVVAIILLITKNIHILSWSLYVFFYPAIVLFWKIPFFIFKQKSWTLAFAFINAVISFFKSMKSIFTTSALFLVSLALIFNCSSKYLLWAAIATFLILLLLTYINRVIAIFKPSNIFQIYITIFSGIRKHSESYFVLEESIKELPVERLDKKQREKWTTNLQLLVLFNRACLFVSKKLRNYQNSRLNIASYVLVIILLIAFTVLSFTAINYACYKIDSSYYDCSAIPTLFTFFYYSFSKLMFGSIKEITPILPISQAISMIECFLTLFIIAIFVTLLFSVKSQKHVDEINEVIVKIKDQGTSMERFIISEYKFNNTDDAITELEKMKAGMIKFIYKITQNIQ